MRLKSFETIIRALNDAGVRYLIAGGLAVNAHGYLRFTKDVDMVIALETDNIRRAIQALEKLGYRPTVPVEAAQFADAAIRQQWISEKGLTVFQLWSEEHIETPIDIFVKEPFDFDEEYQHALQKPLYGKMDVRFVSMPTLVRMKETAGRQQDKIDIEHLRMRMDENG